MKSTLLLLAALAAPVMAERVLPVSTIAAVPASQISIERSLLGQIEALDSATLGFELAGRVDALQVREGDSVMAGQVLAVLDTDLVDQRIAEAKAALVQTQTQLKLSRSTLARLLGAREQGAITDQQIDEARQQLDAASAGLAASQAQLDTLLVERAKHQLIAPFDGQITVRHLSPGAVIGAGAPVFDLVTQQLRARISVPQGLSVEVGQALTLSQGDQSASGEVYAWLPQRDALTAARQAWVSVPAGTGWVSGDWIQAQVIQQQAAQGFWVPVQALGRDAAGWILYRVDADGRAQQTAVQVLQSDGQRALINGPIQAGDTLVSEGLHRMVPGQRVEVAEVVAQ